MLTEWNACLESGTVDEADLKHWIRFYSDLIDWQLYMDSFSRTSSWLLADYLRISESGARFARSACEQVPDEVMRFTLGEALTIYLRQVRRGRVSDSPALEWMEENWT
jgi:hypothetical protein